MNNTSVFRSTCFKLVQIVLNLRKQKLKMIILFRLIFLYLNTIKFRKKVVTCQNVIYYMGIIYIWVLLYDNIDNHKRV